jgi:hypothetical protein
MYKKAAKLKLRFNSPKGLLSVEQLFDLTTSDLANLIKKVNAEIKKEERVDDDLAFLEGKDEVTSLNVLKFDILKDIYLTKLKERDDAATDQEKKDYRQRIAEIIKKKKDQELENLSIEELEKKLNE